MNKTKSRQQITDVRESRGWRRLVRILSCLVVFCTTYAMILPAITASASTYCNQNEHSHRTECYQQQLICSRPGHEHSDDCYDEDGNLICTQPVHHHDPGCYREILICEKEEHVHTTICFSNPEADLESEEDWQRSLPDLDQKSLSERIVAAADSQEDIAESTKNYEVDQISADEVKIRGITRYGQWDQDPYEDFWSASFVRFILNACSIPLTEEKDPQKWMEYLSENGELQAADQAGAGDVIFVLDEKEEDLPKAGIVLAIDQNTSSIETMMGDWQKKVQKVSFSLEDAKIHSIYSVTQDQEPKAEDTTSSAETNRRKEEITAEGDGTEEEQSLSESKAYQKGRQRSAIAETASQEEVIQLRDATVQYKESQYGDAVVWKDIDENTQLKDDYILRFTAKYSIAPESLKKGQSYVFHLPEEFKEVDAVTDGNIVDDNVIVGKYTIQPDGEVSFTFHDDYIDQHAASEITGTFEFTTSVKNIKEEGETETTIQFGDKEIVIHFIDGNQKQGDVWVAKEKISEDTSNTPFKVQYRIRVGSQNGTSDIVQVSDIMQNLNPVSVNEFKIMNGRTGTEIEISRSNTENGFSLKFPEMEAGDWYEISYWVEESSPDRKENYQARNSATATSKDEDGKPIENTSEVTTEFKHELELLKKTNEKTDGKVRWTIVVNQSRVDISGWRLSDILNSQEYQPQEVTIDPPVQDGDEKKAMISLPYTFPEGTNQTYTLTYETPIEVPIGEGHMINKAVLTPDEPGLSQITSSSDAWVEFYEPLSKECVTPPITGEDGSASDEVIIEWKISIDANKGPIPAGTILKDSTNYENWEDGAHHYFTGAQLTEVIQGLETKLASLGFGKDDLVLKARELDASGNEWKTQDEITHDGGDKKYTDFVIELKREIPRGTQFDINYKTTADVSNVQKKDFRNSASLNDKSTKTATFSYEGKEENFLSIEKSPLSEGQNYAELVKDKGILWKIQVNKPASYSGNSLKIAEYLPVNTTLKYLAFTDDWAKDPDAVLFKDGVISEHDGMKLHKNNDQWWDIGIENPMVVSGQPQTFTFVAGVETLDSFGWGDRRNDGSYQASFNNRVILYKNDQTVCGDVYSSQTIQNLSDDDTITKDASIPANKVNVIDYTLDINPEAKDLVPGMDELTLEDDMKFTKREEQQTNEEWWYKAYYNAELDVDSFAVYEVDAEGREKIISPELYSLSIERYRDTQNSDNFHSKFTATVPDSMHLKIRYSYKLETHKNYGGNEAVKAELNNTVSLMGNSKVSADGNHTEYTLQRSSVTANAADLKIIKVDSRNNKYTLPGAEFHLYRYDPKGTNTQTIGSFSGFVDTGIDFVTDDKGEISFGLASTGRSSSESTLLYNTAYILKEVKAPDGYQLPEKEEDCLIKFYVPGETNTKNYPDGFNGTYSEGSRIFFSNERSGARITVHKIWVDQNGADISSKRDNPIEFELWRKTENGTEKKVKSFQIGPTENPQTSWITTINNLDRVDGQGNIYYYSVKEVDSGENYEVSYSADGIAEGVITVTNTLTSDFTLPETGSMAENACQILGTGMLSASLVLYTRKRLKGKRK